MSLKAFHIVFVVLTTLASLGVSGVGWLRLWRRGMDAGDLALGIGGLAFAALLLWYGAYAMRKLRHTSYL